MKTLYTDSIHELKSGLCLYGNSYVNVNVQSTFNMDALVIHKYAQYLDNSINKCE